MALDGDAGVGTCTGVLDGVLGGVKGVLVGALGGVEGVEAVLVSFLETTSTDLTVGDMFIAVVCGGRT